MLNLTLGVQITTGHQTKAVPNVLFCDKSQWCIFISIVFYFFAFLSLCINYEYINKKCLMIRRKIAKGDMNCHSKPNFCFVWTNIIKMVMQSGYSFLKRKIIFAALLIVFFFQKICYLETLILKYVFHRNNIYSRFYDMLSDIWSGTGCTESVKNATDPCCR